ncbi:fasciclin-1-like [Anoplophora glabripennis]|uniref:fasciclin-1-like n=1 Tax=Anoplophora glabripennis TaxID=217634 RepID=UPI000873FB06|nr:fasciclin-1-like [Anoplophora glabripennis]
MRWFLLRFCLLVGLAGQHVQAERFKTIHEKIQGEQEYTSFNDLVRSNRVAKLNLHYEPLTVFVPENRAFDQYEGEIYSDLAFYHMSFEVKTLKLLRTTNALQSANLDNPPLWITKVNDDIYVNSAKILQDKSNYVSRSRSGDMGQQQVLHVIDSVLDPIINSPKFSPNAYDFLTSVHNWNIGSKTITKFHQKAQDNRLLNVFKEKSPHTFFIPVDSGIDTRKYQMIDRKVLLRHVVPNHVLFIRPSERNVVTLSDEDQSPYTLSFERTNERLFVKYISKDDDLEFSSEVLVPDIPVKNGVIHLISQPLGNFEKSLKPFPFLPIMEKISNDPEVDTFYKMGSMTKFNEIFNKKNVNFTYFVPKDSAWNKINDMGLEPIDDPSDILARHLVISDSPYSMQQLVSMSRVNNYTDIELQSEGGPLRMSAFRVEGEYFIKWKRKYIRVLRPDYECTNGIVHVLNGPLVDFTRKKLNQSLNEGSLVGYWNIVKDIIV